MDRGHDVASAVAEEPTRLNGRAEVTLGMATSAFEGVEHIAYCALGLLLAVVAIVGIAHAAQDILGAITVWSNPAGIFAIMDQLLFVLMVVEILHTVRVSMRSGNLTGEPFLIVGLIASIRRVLVITLQSSQAANGTWTDGAERVFRASMIELGVLATLILVMVISIVLLRRNRARIEV